MDVKKERYMNVMRQRERERDLELKRETDINVK